MRMVAKRYKNGLILWLCFMFGLGLSSLPEDIREKMTSAVCLVSTDTESF